MFKALIYTLLITSSAFAQVFTSETTITARHGEHVMPTSFNLLAQSFDPFESRLNVKLNGELTRLYAKKLGRSVEAGVITYTYSASIDTVVTLDGYACDEREDFEYKLYFKVLRSQTNAKEYIVVTDKIVGEYFFSADICHDTSPEKKTVVYNKK